MMRRRQQGRVVAKTATAQYHRVWFPKHQNARLNEIRNWIVRREANYKSWMQTHQTAVCMYGFAEFFKKVLEGAWYGIKRLPRWYVERWICIIVGDAWLAVMTYLLYPTIVVVCEVLDTLMGVIGSVVSVAEGVVNSVTGFLGHSSGSSWQFPSGRSTMDRMAWYRTFSALPSTCEDLNSSGAVLDAIVRVYLSPEICPVGRYLWVVRFLFVVFSTFLGWAMYDPAPFPGANCEAPEGENVCIWLQFGWVIKDTIPTWRLYEIIIMSAWDPGWYAIHAIVWWIVRLCKAAWGLLPTPKVHDYDEIGF